MIYSTAASLMNPKYSKPVEVAEPPTASYDVDFQAKIDYANANNIPVPSQSTLDYYNKRIIDYKATGAFEKDDAIFDLTGVDDTYIDFRLICIKRKIKADAYGSLTWSGNGVKGNGTNGYIDPLYDPSTFKGNWVSDSASVGFKTFDIGTVGTRTITGSYTGSNDSYVLIIPNNATSSYHNMHKSATTRNSYASTDYTQIDRVSIYSQAVNGVDMSGSSGGGISGSLYILARNYNGTADLHSDAGLEWISFGSDKSAEYEAIKTALDESV